MIENLQRIRSKLDSDTILILVNGSEVRFDGKISEIYKDREKIHYELNKAVDDFVNNSENCYVVDIKKIIDTSSLYLDNLNHYKKVVYYKMAEQINAIISKTGNEQLESVSKD